MCCHCCVTDHTEKNWYTVAILGALQAGSRTIVAVTNFVVDVMVVLTVFVPCCIGGRNTHT